MRIGPITDESPSQWEIYANYKRSSEEKQGSAGTALTAGKTQESAATKAVNASAECETCSNRTYQDGSNDPGVSFKTPTRISPGQAESAIRGHEMEHVNRNQAVARREDREVVSQSVTYHNAICTECGRVYMSGGTTRTTTRGSSDPEPADPIGNNSGFSATV